MTDTDLPLNRDPCPICGSIAAHLMYLPFNNSKKILETICNAPFSPKISYPDYELLKCGDCTLEFASPLIEPNNHFYLWLTDQQFPYVKTRWEWSQAIALLKEDTNIQSSNLCLVDIGCGTGNFLSIVKEKLNCNAIGIDHNENAVTQCVSRGLMAYCCDISNIRSIFPNGAHIVTLWHILEHINNPLETLKNIKNQMNIDGIIFVSVPLSPMISEALEPDPFNLPPHHLTRWNLQSLKVLSETLNMKAEFYSPMQVNIIYATLKSLIFSSTKGKLNLKKTTKLYLLVRFMVSNPSLVIQAFIQLKKLREKNSIQDIVLMKLTNR